MSVAEEATSPWLLLVFNLPSVNGSARVDIWRKLKRHGALPLRTSGYVLPNTPDNLERFEWIAVEIRKYKGQASVAQVQSFDNLPHERMVQLFNEERNKDYEELLRELKPARSRKLNPASIRRKLQEIINVDFFKSPMRKKVEAMVDAIEKSSQGAPPSSRRRGRREYSNRSWITRHRPGIDRSASAWLIQRFIDPRAKFVFGSDPKQNPGAIPYDMFGQEGFGHRAAQCTFETLCHEFSLKDPKLRAIAEIVHDADLHDDKYGRAEGAGVDRILKGWAQQGVSDEELLRRGIELFEGLYNAIT
jgi:hypothetical protein